MIPYNPSNDLPSVDSNLQRHSPSVDLVRVDDLLHLERHLNQTEALVLVLKLRLQLLLHLNNP